MSIDLENFPTSETAQRMLSYVTKGWYDKSYVGKWIFQVMGEELDTWLEIIEDLPNQLFVETATWALSYHELKYGLSVRADLPKEERRMRVLEVRDSKMPMSPYGMAKQLKESTGYNVYIYDTNEPGSETFSHPNTFWVRFEGDSEISILDALKKVRALKQSHTTFDFSVLFMTILNDEKFTPRVKYRMAFAWWDKYMDGAYLMNGAINMDMSYPDMFDRIRCRAEVENENDIGFNWLIPIYNNGTETMNGRIKMNCGREVL